MHATKHKPDKADPASGDNPTAALAVSYIRRGWNPVPIPLKSKTPTDTGWESRIIAEADVPDYFNGAPKNIGIILGTTSNGLTDVDLDCAEAIAIASVVLPPTGAIFGRASKRDSHWLYISTLATTLGKNWLKLKDPLTKGALLELRAGPAAQTVFPGSVHESGEEIAWSVNRDPAVADDDDLTRRILLLGCLVLFARYFPVEGGRHDAALTLGGFLSRAGYKPAEIRYYVERVALVAGSKDPKARGKDAKDAAEAHQQGEHTYGYTELQKIFSKEVADQAAEWLDYNFKDQRSDYTGSNTGSTGPGNTGTGNTGTGNGTNHNTGILVATPYVWIDPEKIPPREWLYGHRLIRKYATATVAQGGLGKSQLEIAEMLAMVSGSKLLGTCPSHCLKVWYWNLEDTREEIERRIQATAKYYELKPDDLDGLFVDCGRERPLVIAESLAHSKGAWISRPVVDVLIAEIIARKIDVLIIDPFVSCHRVAENDNNAMDAVVKEWANIAERANCSVELVHHIRKGEHEVTAESSRGGGSFIDACRAVRVANRMSEAEAEKAGVDNRRLFFRCYNDKVNMAPPVENSDWYKLVSVDLGNSALGPGIVGGDDIGVVTKWEWPDHLAGVSGADFDKVAAVIRAGKWRFDSQSDGWVGIAVAKAMNLRITDKADRAKIVGLLKVWFGTGALIKVTAKDENYKNRVFVEVRDDG